MNVISATVFSCLIITLMTNAQNYNNRVTLFYEDLGCKPIKAKPTDQFASSFNCDEPFNNPCFYKNKIYKLKEPVPWQLSLLSCSSSCRCRENGFVCAELRCPEIGQVTLTSSKCYHIYTINECCNVGEVCPPFDDVPTCSVDGKTYMKGQRFFPNGTILECICDENFNGKYDEPYCRKIDCGIKLKYIKEIEDRCAPFYDRNEEKCPSSWSWICPSEEFTDSIVSVSKPRGSKLSCVYGKKNIALHDYFEREPSLYSRPSNTRVRCTCSVPPLLTCVPS
ncbi:hypothetical protein RI129_008097 [Pyrocoelia pectoralis]|uniref:VWFC domain-containing protein n=1 Tax=Pyrocoelia pectoralis TaxID=417401 RepID=A0AAN7ZHK3_9COLE